MKQYQIRSTFISTKGLLILCLLLLVNAVFNLFLSASFHERWFDILTSFFLFVFLVGILFESRKVKSFKVSKEKLFFNAKVIDPDDLLRITIRYKQIELTQAERLIFKKVLLIRVVNSEELKSLTDELLEFAKEHGITIVNQI